MGYRLGTHRSYVGGTFHATAEDMLLLIEGRFFGVTNGVEETNCVLLSETIATLDDMFCSMETSNYVDHLFSCCTLVIYKKISALVADSWWGADLTRCKHLHAKCSEVIPLGFQRYLSCVSTLTCLLTLRGYDLLCSSACSTQ